MPKYNSGKFVELLQRVNRDIKDVMAESARITEPNDIAALNAEAMELIDQLQNLVEMI